MKANWKALGILAVSAAVLYYPALKLYQYINKKRSGKPEGGADHHVVKAFVPAYRGKHNSRHRHPKEGPADLGHA